MHWNMIQTIFRKDLRDAIRDSRVLIAILVPLGIGLFYNYLFDDETPTPSADVAYTASGDTTVIDALRSVVGDTVELTLLEQPSADDVRRLVQDEDADIGLIIPAGFDAGVRSGATPTLTVILPESPTFGGDYVAASIEPALRQLAGQQPPARIDLGRVSAGESGDRSVFEDLGPRTYFVLVAIVMLIAMICMLAIPIILTEEAEKKTLDALVMVASYLDVVLAKSLVGLTYIAVAVALLLGLTGLSPTDIPLFAVAVALLSVTLIGFGLLIGGLFRNANQLNTWAGVFILPVIAPAFIVGLPVPDIVDSILDFIPSSQGMRLLVNSMTDQPFFEQSWLAYVVLIVWAAAAFVLLVQRLSRREA